MSTLAGTGPEVTARARDALPRWSSALAVVAHPDDESFGLGAILDAFARGGTTAAVLCLTRGEASSLHAVSGDLATLRESELREAAHALGVQTALLREHADGSLDGAAAAVVDDVLAVARELAPDGLVVFDPSGVTGHPDHAAATAAALRAAETLDLPVLGWTVPEEVAATLNDELGTAFAGHPAEAIDLVVGVDRERQRIASLAHASQAVPTSVLWRRLELLGDVEHLRWLRAAPPPRTDDRKDTPVTQQSTTPQAPAVERMRVDHRGGDRFDIAIRDHVVTVDQPVDVGGEDVGPTPTELFVAGLVSCVAFYARRYLRRHHLDEEGLAVEAAYQLTTKPARVGSVDIRITPPASLPEERRDGLLAVASHCTVHNSIMTAPDITVDFT